MTGDPLLEVDDLRTTFATPAGDVLAVAGVSLEVAPGATLGIVGESGSGKSVLARSILRLADGPNTTVTGRVQLDGRDLLDLAPGELRRVRGRTAAMIFQDPMTALSATMRIGNQLGESLRENLGLGRRERRQAAIALLETVGIPDAARHMRSYPHQLSGGMRLRAMIAIALACGPKLVIADEPTTALDVTMQRQVLDLLEAEQRDREMAMILITHDFGVVAGRADHVAVMYAGRVVERAPTRELLDRPRHPYTSGLLRSIPLLSDPPGKHLDAIPGSPPALTPSAPGCRFAPRCASAQPRCLAETPGLEPIADGQASAHEHACFFPLGTAHGDAARTDNAAAGITAAGLRLLEAS